VTGATRAGAPATSVTAFAPGRVNVIGEHTDYNDGLCLPFAIAAGVRATITPGDEGTLRVVAADLGEEDEFALAAIEPARGWCAFARGLAAELQRAGHRLRGGVLEVSGDVPRGAGLSSSAALEVAIALALLGHAGEPAPGRLALARLCSRVENAWVGAATGLLDQIAALFGREGSTVRIDMRSLTIDYVPVALDGWRLAVVHSGVAHEHAAGGYNERRRECREACAALGVASLRDADPEAIAALRPPLDRRARHVVAENARVDAAVTALGDGDGEALGRLLDASHASLRDLFEVSVPEVDAVVERLLAAGAAGARMVGGGFGGSVLGLFEAGAALPDGAVEVRPSAGARIVAGAERW
jgi:galactokinase